MPTRFVPAITMPPLPTAIPYTVSRPTVAPNGPYDIPLPQFLRLLEDHGLVAIDDRALATRQFLGLINEPLLWARVIGAEPAPNRDRRNIAVEQAVDVFLSHYGQR